MEQKRQKIISDDDYLSSKTSECCGRQNYDDHDGVVPLAQALQGLPEPAHLVIDVADHPVVLRPQRPHRRLVGGCHEEGVFEHALVQGVALVARRYRQRDLKEVSVRLKYFFR